MELEELYEIVDIEDGSDFVYFENLSELFESDKEIPSDLIYELLQDIDINVLSELFTTYFDQIEEAVPDDETDFYMLIENMKNVMTGMAESASIEDEGEEYDRILMELAEEMGRFHEWYIEEGKVAAVNEETGESTNLSVRDALFQARACKLTDEVYRFDFSNATDYELSEYVMSFADLAQGE